MSNTQKKTQKELYNEVLEIVKDNPELKTFIEGRIEQLAKKSAKDSGKLTEVQKANKTLAETIYNSMPMGVAMTIEDIRKAVPTVSDLSAQKVTPLVAILVTEGKVEKCTQKVKGRTVYKKIETEVEGE